MTKINVSITDEAREFLEKQASKQGLSTSSEVIERLVRDAMARQEQENLEQQLIDGLKSGPGIDADDEYWERKQASLIGRAKNAQGGDRA